MKNTKIIQVFQNPETAVSLLTGKDKGTCERIAVNFVMNRIGNLAKDESTIAIMNLNKVSVQSVFEVDQTEELLYFNQSVKALNFSENLGNHVLKFCDQIKIFVLILRTCIRY